MYGRKMGKLLCNFSLSFPTGNSDVDNNNENDDGKRVKSENHYAVDLGNFQGHGQVTAEQVSKLSLSVMYIYSSKDVSYMAF